jgi:hypothetical protein
MNRILKTLFFFGILTTSIQIQSQNIVIVQDPKISNLVQEHRNATTKIDYIEGYRIQIFFDSGNNSKSNADVAKSKFSTQYPDVPIYLSFKEPNFKVRVGDFRTRNEARGFLKQISIEYPNAFVIKDEIKLPILILKTERTE